MPRLGGKMVPARRLGRMVLRAFALKIVLANEEGSFDIPRPGRCREKREGAFRRGLRDTLGARPRIFRRAGCKAIKLLRKNIRPGHAGGHVWAPAKTTRL